MLYKIIHFSSFYKKNHEKIIIKNTVIFHICQQSDMGGCAIIKDTINIKSLHNKIIKDTIFFHQNVIS